MQIPQCNYGVRFDGPYGVDHMIRGLCQEVERRMNKVGVRGSRITLKVKKRKQGARPPPKFLGHGSCHNLSKSSDLSSASCEWQCMNMTATVLFKALDVSLDDIRGMGIVISKLIADDGNASNAGATNPAQRSISTLFAAHRASKSSECQQVNDSAKGELVPSPEVGQRAATSSTKQQESSGIVLPSSSQIHMSQVKELPSPLRKEITFEMRRRERVAQHRPGENFQIGRGQGEVDIIDLSSRKQNDHEVEVLSDSDSVVHAATPRRQGSRFDDVALPPMSQIHMSQVKALPIALQKQITKRMETEAEPVVVDTDLPAALQHSHVTGRLRQTDMKRMLKLAAVKSKPGDVSLAELESLPLEMQLQVANNDTQRVGLLAPPPRGQHHQASTDAIQRRRVLPRSESPNPLATTNSAAPAVPSLPEPPPAPLNDFYVSTIVPLTTFMDDHPDAGAEAQNMVLDFLHICISEHRLSDVVHLLRCIYRHTSWRGVAYESIVGVVDRRVHTILQCGLDLDWIEGT